MNSRAAGVLEQSESFRREVGDFLNLALTPKLQERVRAGVELTKEDLLDWHRSLYGRGWIAPNWPAEFGGASWSPRQQVIFDDECARAGAPMVIPMGLTIVGPILIAYGSDAQRTRFLPRILDGSEVWCQGFSEPEAGSDLASLRCRAERDGDEYVVNGIKLWTTYAHWADWCVLLVRTRSGERKQDGISILLVDMRTRGISIRPLITIDGLHSFNEVRFDDVRVPVSQRVGPEHEGWTILKAVIGRERVLVIYLGQTRAMIEKLKAVALQEVRHGRPLLEDPIFRHRLARIEMNLEALDALAERFLNDPELAAKPEASMLKIRGSEVQQELTRLCSESLGYYALPYQRDAMARGWSRASVGPPYAPPITPHYLFWRRASISGGTREIQKNIMAKAVLAGKGSDQMQESLLFQQALRFLADQQEGCKRSAIATASAAGSDPELWRRFAELGWLGLPFAQEHGGTGGSLSELLDLMRAFGQHLVVEPYLSTVVLAGRAIAIAGSPSQRQHLLARISDGSMQAAFAFAEPRGGYELEAVTTRADRRDDGYRLSGGKCVVLGADSADVWVVVARTSGEAREREGLSLFLVYPSDAGVQIRGYPTIDARRAADLAFHGVVLPADRLLGQENDAWHVLQDVASMGTLAVAADALGCVETAIALTTDHLLTRRQFGRPLADFQVLQHRLVEMCIAREELRSLLMRAGTEFETMASKEQALLLHTIKYYAGWTAREVGEQAIQLHGAMGICDEVMVSHCLRRAVTIDRLFGDTDYHIGQFAALSLAPA